MAQRIGKSYHIELREKPIDWHYVTVIAEMMKKEYKEKYYENIGKASHKYSRSQKRHYKKNERALMLLQR